MSDYGYLRDQPPRGDDADRYIARLEKELEKAQQEASSWSLTLARVSRRLAAAEELLRELEWVHQGEAGAAWEECPVCEHSRTKGHAPDCKLALFLNPAV